MRGGGRSKASLPCCCSLVGVVVAAVVPLVLVVGFVAANVGHVFFEIVSAICSIQAAKSVFCFPRFCSQCYGLHVLFAVFLVLPLVFLCFSKGQKPTKP